jgi:hypothetical protein
LARQAGPSISAFLDTHSKEEMRDDSRVLIALMQEPA